MNKFVLAFISIVLCGCSGCTDDKKKPYEGFLDKDREFVIAHVAPDEDRINPVEVFVGRLLTIVPDSTDGANIQDYLLKIQLRQFQNEYYALLKYHDDAQVFITSSGQTVELQNVGKGTYRDVSNALHISALQTCTLKVTRPGGKVYQAMVRVPDHITITSLSPGDTTVLYPKKNTPESDFCGAVAYISGPAVTGAYIYRSKFDETAHLQSSNNSGSAVIIELCGGVEYTNISETVMAFDTVLTRAWGMGEDTGFGYDLFDSLLHWRSAATPITYRSNITNQDGAKIAGYFGAYNSINTHFVVKSLRDSCQCNN